jgi:hypothetical protein
MMEARKLALTALRVLSAWTKGKTSESNDVKILRAHALSEEADLPADELACRIIARACQAMIQKAPVDRSAAGSKVAHRRKQVE